MLGCGGEELGQLVGYEALGTCTSWLWEDARGFIQGYLDVPHISWLLQHL